MLQIMNTSHRIKWSIVLGSILFIFAFFCIRAARNTTHNSKLYIIDRIFTFLLTCINVSLINFNKKKGTSISRLSTNETNTFQI